MGCLKKLPQLGIFFKFGRRLERIIPIILIKLIELMLLLNLLSM